MRKPTRAGNPDILTVNEASVYLHVDRVTLYRLLKRGVVPAFKTDHHWRFNKSQFDDWMRGQTEATRRQQGNK